MPQNPHIFGITLDGTGVAFTQVVCVNTANNDRQIGSTDVNKQVIFDAANFSNDYTNGDVVIFENVGSSNGGTTITIDTTQPGFQEATLTCSAALAISIDL